MARVQTDATINAEALRTVAAPRVQAAQVFADPMRSSTYQLLEAFGSPNTGQRLADLQKQVQDKSAEQARRDFNSMTVDEAIKLRKVEGALKSGDPIYVATIEHLTGEAGLNKITNETVQKINRGELKFNSTEELDSYLTNQRNDFLSGLSKYAVAGFDKKYDATRQQLFDANNKFLDSKFVEHGNQTAIDAFNTDLNEIQSKKLAPGVGAAKLISRYDLLVSTNVLTNSTQQREALKGAAYSLAAAGDMATLNTLLDSKLPRNGPSVRALIGDTDSIMLQKSAEGVFDGKMRVETDNGLQPFRQQANRGELNEKAFDKYVNGRLKYVGSDTIESIRQHSLNVQAAKLRELAELDEKLRKEREKDAAAFRAQNQVALGLPVTDAVLSTGEVIKADEVGYKAIQSIIDANPNMSPQEVIRRFASSGVQNPEWKREFNTALFNIGEVNIDASNKPVGQLTEPTINALNKFALVRQVSEGYARDMAGGERNYEMLTHIQALREEGIGDVNLAAALVNQKARRNIPSKVWGNIQDSVASEIEKVTNPGMFTQRYWSEVFRWETGKGEKNILPIKNSVRSLAETYLASGVANSGEQAVKMAADYYARPEVSTQINNTIYLNKDLPDLPQGVNRTKWFSRAMDEVVGEKLKAKGINYSRSDLTLIPQQGGSAPYLIALRGQPTTIYVTKDELKTWIKSARDKEDTDLVNKSKKKPDAPAPKPTNPVKPSLFETEKTVDDLNKDMRGRK